MGGVGKSRFGMVQMQCRNARYYGDVGKVDMIKSIIWDVLAAKWVGPLETSRLITFVQTEGVYIGLEATKVVLKAAGRQRSTIDIVDCNININNCVDCNEHCWVSGKLGRCHPSRYRPAPCSIHGQCNQFQLSFFLPVPPGNVSNFSYL